MTAAGHTPLNTKNTIEILKTMRQNEASPYTARCLLIACVLLLTAATHAEDDNDNDREVTTREAIAAMQEHDNDTVARRQELAVRDRIEAERIQQLEKQQQLTEKQLSEQQSAVPPVLAVPHPISPEVVPSHAVALAEPQPNPGLLQIIEMVLGALALLVPLFFFCRWRYLTHKIAKLDREIAQLDAESADRGI
jgi:hypothetical protein